VDSERSEVISATVRADHLARFDRLVAKRRVERSALLAKAIDGVLAWHDLAGGYVGPRNDLPMEGFPAEVITARVRADHLARFDELAARRGVSRSVLVGQAIDSLLAKEAMIGAFGTPGTAAWFAPPNDASIWASIRSAAAPGKRSRLRLTKQKRGRSGSRSTGA
jgi:predicted transcriptional regulator